MSGKGNRPVAFRPVPRGKMLTSSSKARQDIKRSRPESQNTLGVAKVINIDDGSTILEIARGAK